MEERLDDAIHVLKNHAEGHLGHEMAAIMGTNGVAMPPMGPAYLGSSGLTSARDNFRVIIDFACL